MYTQNTLTYKIVLAMLSRAYFGTFVYYHIRTYTMIKMWWVLQFLDV